MSGKQTPIEIKVLRYLSTTNASWLASDNSGITEADLIEDKYWRDTLRALAKQGYTEKLIVKLNPARSFFKNKPPQKTLTTYKITAKGRAYLKDHDL